MTNEVYAPATAAKQYDFIVADDASVTISASDLSDGKYRFNKPITTSEVGLYIDHANTWSYLL